MVPIPPIREPGYSIENGCVCLLKNGLSDRVFLGDFPGMGGKGGGTWHVGPKTY